MTTLITARLTLRSPRPGDLDDLHAIYGDGRAMRYWSSLPHGELDTTRAMLDTMIAAFADQPTYFIWDHSGRAIGAGGMHAPWEVGFILHPDHWRKGLAREAMSAIILHLWATTRAPALTADTDPRNAASIGLLAALGFVEAGRARNTFVVGGEWSDSIYFALARP
ncbi:MAG: GNAT family N-acetyltransferase [Alphaproteobacteria bacterium]|nr:GNAT family N-acetyltransferase [Alphaproteobacteria bacterium]